MDKHPKRPRDPSQLAKMMVDLASGEVVEHSPGKEKDSAAVALGRKGGLKGGKSRSERMSPQQRSAAAQRAAKARWAK